MAWYSPVTKIFGRPTNPTPGVSGVTTANTIESPDDRGLQSHRAGYRKLEIVNRAVNMIVDDCSNLDITIEPNSNFRGATTGTKLKTLHNLLNVCPNPEQDISDFRRRLFTDYLLYGNMFIYYDGVHIYQLPAEFMSVKGDDKAYIKEFIYREAIHADKMTYTPTEVVHVRENHVSNDKFVGLSRLSSQTTSMATLLSMKEFQQNFFNNSAVPGLVVTTENHLSDRVRSSFIERWQQVYNPAKGG